MKASVRGSAKLSSAFVVAALGVISASAQLNPTVKVLPKPQSTVPPECEQGLAPAVPRVIIAETQTEQPKPASVTAPPSLDLKTRLRAVQVAAEHKDRDAFKAALADARSAAASYPAGGERSAANDVLSVDNDLERLWDYQFTSPTGAFFDSSTDFVAMMHRYPDYSRYIRDLTLNVSGQTVYPSEETRQFLTSEAARRLERLGVRTPTRITEIPPPPTPRVAPTPAPQPVPRAAPAPKPTTKRAAKTPRPTTKRAGKAQKPATRHAARATPHKATKRPKPPQVAEATTTPPKPRVAQPTPQPQPQPPPVPAPQPVTPPPAPVPAPQPVTSPAPVPAQVVAPQPAPPPAPVPVPMPQPTTATSAPTTETTATTATTATATTTTTAPQNPTPSGGRMNLLFAIILIIVGIGVLIILFRASD